MMLPWSLTCGGMEKDKDDDAMEFVSMADTGTSQVFKAACIT